MKIITGINQRWAALALVCFLSFGAVTTSGCASKSKTTTVTTTTTNDSSVSGDTTSVTTQQSEEVAAHPRGIIGGVFYTIGQVLLFPFRVIGNLFS